MAYFVVYFRVLIQLILIELYFKIGCAANPHITVYNHGSAFNNGGQLQCYPTDSRTTITMGKVFRISDSDSLNEATPGNQGAYAGAKRLYIPYDGNFFGVYYCKGVLNGETTIVNTTVVDQRNAFNSNVIPINYKTSITASVGESVTVSFDVTVSGNRIWRKDGKLLDNNQDLYDDASLTFDSVRVEDGGMFELYIEGQRDEYKHSFIELIVRDCPAGRWGAPGCTGVCNNCYNGGVCDDETGKCVCPPGFEGENCEGTCGGNRFGITCQIRCTRNAADPKDTCKGNNFCLPKPYGCDCVTGYTGRDCLTACGSGKFGAGCSQECHCMSGTCNRYTGVCSPNTCASGWSGSNCQVPSICPVGYFGTNCTSICHCHGNVQCDKETGVCSNNAECAKGYRIYANSFCEKCQPGSYGDSCASNCNCDSASCHHETGCDGGCFNNWLANTCTTGISSFSNTKVNPGQTTTFQCVIQGDVAGVTIQLLIDSQPATETRSTESNGVTRVSFTGEANPGIAYVCQLTKDSHTASETLSNTTYELPTYTGKPTSETITGSSVKLKWKEWSTSSGDTGDPPVVGYVVYYKVYLSESWSQVPQVSSLTATVTGLHWEQRYKFAIAAVREGDGGEGPMGSGRLSAWTLCGEPSAPVVSTNSSYDSPKTINIFWKQLTIEESKCSTGVTHYNVSYKAVNTDMGTVTEETTEELSYTIMGLETYTEYSIAVTASNKHSFGIARVVQVFSPEEIPPHPDVKAEHEGTYLTVYVMLSESIESNLYGVIKGYDVRYRLADTDEEWVELTITKDQGSNGYKITSLKTEANYEVGAKVVNGAGKGDWSISIKAETITETDNSSTATIIGAVVGILVLVCIIAFLALFLLRRQRRNPGKQNDTLVYQHQESTFSENHKQSQEYLSPDVFKPKEEITTPELERKAGRVSIIPQLPDNFEEMYQNVENIRPISVKDLPDFVAKKRLNTLDGLQHEYGKLPKGQMHPWEVASRSANRTKNRFKNIVAYDHSRVVLEELEDDPESGYINACYVDGYNKSKFYIASQGPNNASLIDFWRMIWQENVASIVMLTNIIESGKEKCKKYWPENRGHIAEFGDLNILLEVTENYADYKIRSFKVWEGDSVDFRRVKQYHFTSWPDMGVPLYATAALNFIKKIKHDRPQTSAPVLVHCSAGVGRTGTFIAIDAMLEMIDKEKKVDVFNFLRKVRDQRINMVQTPEQYVFIYDALLEYCLCGDTALNTSNFQTRLSQLKRLNPQTKRTYLEEEFEVLQHVTPYPTADHCKGGHKPENIKKNRVSNIIPIDRNRPFLVTESSTGGNEYINASFLDGYRQKDKFIATQMPLPSTVGDMWRLIFDWNVRSVVMLNDMDADDASCAQYWMDTEGSSEEFGPLVVKLESKQKKGDHITVRQFKVVNKNKSNASCIVHQYQVHGWMVNQDIPERSVTLLEVLEMVDNNQHDYHHGNHPILVHCINGIGRSGIYCTVVEVVERMKLENVIDVFQTLKKLRSNRPGLVQNVDQYIFCYDIISNYLGCFETYANPNS